MPIAAKHKPHKHIEKETVLNSNNMKSIKNNLLLLKLKFSLNVGKKK